MAWLKLGNYVLMGGIVAVPAYHEFMLPILRIAADGADHDIAAVREKLAEELALSESDRRETVPSGTQTTLVNRVHWAATYLRKAQALERTGRGRFRITDRGLSLAQDGLPITPAALGRFPEFLAFKGSSGAVPVTSGELEPTSSATPRELLESSYELLRKSLADELLERMKSGTPEFFEGLVVELMVAMGYGGSRADAGQALGRSGDGGVDGLIKQDRLGLETVYLQAKRWEGVVGRPQIQGFAGSLDGFHAQKGVFITTSSFTKEALDYVTRIEKKIVLISGEKLADFMIDFDVGVVPDGTFVVKRIDESFFLLDI